MNILALDASGPSASAALLLDGALRAERFLDVGLNHSVTLMPMIEGIMAQCGVMPGALDAIACVVGPGSFTGVRIGVSTARALSFATGVPCIAIDALEVLAAGLYRCEGIACPLLNARRSNVYAAAFAMRGETPERLMDDAAMGIGAYLDAVTHLGAPLVFLGDGALAYRDIIMETCGGRASFAPPHLNAPRAAAAAVLAARGEHPLLAHDALKPLYLRPPQAEREAQAREAQGTGEAQEAKKAQEGPAPLDSLTDAAHPGTV